MASGLWGSHAQSGEAPSPAGIGFNLPRDYLDHTAGDAGPSAVQSDVLTACYAPACPAASGQRKCLCGTLMAAISPAPPRLLLRPRASEAPWLGSNSLSL